MKAIVTQVPNNDQINKNNTIKIKAMKTLTNKLLAILFVLTQLSVYAQRNDFRNLSCDLGVQNIVTGSGHGILRSPYVLIQHKTNAISVGLNIQGKMNNHVSGINVSYKKLFDVESMRQTLYAEYTLIYHKSAYLSKRLQQVFSHHELSYSNIRFSTIGHYAGFGSSVTLFKHLNLNAGLGFGYYQTLKGGEQIDEEYQRLRTNKNFSLMIKYGISFSM